MGWGDTLGSLTVYQISDHELQYGSRSAMLISVSKTAATAATPSRIHFLQSRRKSAVRPGTAGEFFRRRPARFSCSIHPVQSSHRRPIHLASANFLNGIVDPQAPFTYVGNSGPTTYGISVYQVDLLIGFAQPARAHQLPRSFRNSIFLHCLPPSSRRARHPRPHARNQLPAHSPFAQPPAGQSSGSQEILLKSLGSQVRQPFAHPNFRPQCRGFQRDGQLRLLSRSSHQSQLHHCRYLRARFCGTSPGHSVYYR